MDNQQVIAYSLLALNEALEGNIDSENILKSFKRKLIYKLDMYTPEEAEKKAKNL